MLEIKYYTLCDFIYSLIEHAAERNDDKLGELINDMLSDVNNSRLIDELACDCCNDVTYWKWASKNCFYGLDEALKYGDNDEEVT